MITNPTGRYVPPPIEAPSANQVGFVAIGIITVFLVSLLLLDLATLWHDILWFCANIRLQLKLLRAKIRIRKAKKEAKRRLNKKV